MEGGDERSEAIQKRKNALRMGIGELREKHCNNKNYACNQLQDIYTRTNFLRLR